MADKTKIEWADATLNYLNGCSVLSPGCTNCYAMKLAGTRLKHTASRKDLTRDTKAGPVWTGEVRAHEPALLQALTWKAPRRIFWNAHGDLFHEAVPDEWIDRLFAVCALTPQHTHMILTKRSARMLSYCRSLPNRDDLVTEAARSIGCTLESCRIVGVAMRGGPLPNIWLGVSIEDQARANERIPDLLQTPAAVRFLSCEPLLGPVDLTSIEFPNERGGTEWWDALDLHLSEGDEAKGCTATLDWIIAGGESGPGARPMHPDWARTLRDQCAATETAFHFKQWGEWAPVSEMESDSIEACYHPAPARQPEATRRCKVDQCVLHREGERFDGSAMFARPAFEQGSGAMTMFAIGKKRAGRLLDGRTHDEFPA